MSQRRIKTFVIKNGYRKQQVVEFQQTWNLTLYGSPTGLVFTINDQEYQIGEVLQLENGEYHYTAHLPNSNYSIRSGVVTIQGADAVLDVALSKNEKPTTIKVVNAGGTPLSGVQVFADGQTYGGLTNTAGEAYHSAFPAGEHIIYATADMYYCKPQVAVIDGGTYELKMEGITDPFKGVLAIVSSTYGSSIFLNENLVGEKVFSDTLPAGKYVVKVSAPGYKEYITTVQVDSQKVTTLNVNLIKDVITGKLTIATVYDELELSERPDIYLDGVYYGKTPKTLTKVTGTYNLTLKKPKFQNYVAKQLVIEAGKVTTPVQEGKITMEPIVNKPEGTIEDTICIGYDKYNVVADGYGGTRNVLVEKNSTFCKFPSTRQLTVFTNVPALVEVRQSNGEPVALSKATDRNTSGITSQSNAVTLTLENGKTYVVKAYFNPTKATQTEMDSAPYKEMEVFLDFSDRFTITPHEIILPLKPMEKVDMEAVYELVMNEEDYVPNQHTSGEGYLSYIKETNSIEAGAFIRNYLGLAANTKGTLSMYIKDANGNIISNKSLSHGANTQYTKLTYTLPSSASSVVFDQARATRMFTDLTEKGVSEVVWTGNSSFTYTCSAWQGSLEFRAGKVRIQMSVPFSFRNNNG